MVIEGEDFKIQSIGDASYFFDLEILKEVKGKTGIRKEFNNVGYGMTLENCIKKIIMFRINTKFDTLDLNNFLIEYKKAKDEILHSINTTTKYTIRES